MWTLCVPREEGEFFKLKFDTSYLIIHRVIDSKRQYSMSCTEWDVDYIQ